MRAVALDDRTFYARWIVANGLAESSGLGTTFAVGQALAPALQRITGALAIVGSPLVAVALGTLLEGALVGLAQERVLRQRLARLRHGSWIAATSAGALTVPRSGGLSRLADDIVGHLGCRVSGIQLRSARRLPANRTISTPLSAALSLL